MALLIIPVLKRWPRSRGPYGNLRTWNWPITAREISQPYNNLQYFGHFIFLFFSLFSFFFYIQEKWSENCKHKFSVVVFKSVAKSYFQDSFEYLEDGGKSVGLYDSKYCFSFQTLKKLLDNWNTYVNHRRWERLCVNAIKLSKPLLLCVALCSWSPVSLVNLLYRPIE